MIKGKTLKYLFSCKSFNFGRWNTLGDSSAKTKLSRLDFPGLTKSHHLQSLEKWHQQTRCKCSLKNCCRGETKWPDARKEISNLHPKEQFKDFLKSNSISAYAHQNILIHRQVILVLNCYVSLSLSLSPWFYKGKKKDNNSFWVLKKWE